MKCRAARERLNWTRHELAEATDVPLWFIAAFEDGRETPGFLVCWEIAIEAALRDELSARDRFVAYIGAG
jgi:DNA-binding XRE family transcriptional regulator